MDKKITSTNSQQDEQKDRLSTAAIKFQGFFGADPMMAIMPCDLPGSPQRRVRGRTLGCEMAC